MRRYSLLAAGNLQGAFMIGLCNGQIRVINPAVLVYRCGSVRARRWWGRVWLAAEFDDGRGVTACTRSSYSPSSRLSISTRRQPRMRQCASDAGCVSRTTCVRAVGCAHGCVGSGTSTWTVSHTPRRLTPPPTMSVCFPRICVSSWCITFARGVLFWMFQYGTRSRSCGSCYWCTDTRN